MYSWIFNEILKNDDPERYEQLKKNRPVHLVDNDLKFAIGVLNLFNFQDILSRIAYTGEHSEFYNINKVNDTNYEFVADISVSELRILYESDRITVEEHIIEYNKSFIQYFEDKYNFTFDWNKVSESSKKVFLDQGFSYVKLIPNDDKTMIHLTVGINKENMNYVIDKIIKSQYNTNRWDKY